MTTIAKVDKSRPATRSNGTEKAVINSDLRPTVPIGNSETKDIARKPHGKHRWTVKSSSAFKGAKSPPPNPNKGASLARGVWISAQQERRALLTLKAPLSRKASSLKLSSRPLDPDLDLMNLGSFNGMTMNLGPLVSRSPTPSPRRHSPKSSLELPPRSTSRIRTSRKRSRSRDSHGVWSPLKKRIQGLNSPLSSAREIGLPSHSPYSISDLSRDVETPQPTYRNVFPLNSKGSASSQFDPSAKPNSIIKTILSVPVDPNELSNRRRASAIRSRSHSRPDTPFPGSPGSFNGHQALASEGDIHDLIQQRLSDTFKKSEHKPLADGRAEGAGLATEENNGETSNGSDRHGSAQTAPDPIYSAFGRAGSSTEFGSETPRTSLKINVANSGQELKAVHKDHDPQSPQKGMQRSESPMVDKHTILPHNAPLPPIKLWTNERGADMRVREGSISTKFGSKNVDSICMECLKCQSRCIRVFENDGCCERCIDRELPCERAVSTEECQSRQLAVLGKESLHVNVPSPLADPYYKTKAETGTAGPYPLLSSPESSPCQWMPARPISQPSPKFHPRQAPSPVYARPNPPVYIMAAPAPINQPEQIKKGWVENWKLAPSERTQSDQKDTSQYPASTANCGSAPAPPQIPLSTHRYTWPLYNVTTQPHPPLSDHDRPPLPQPQCESSVTSITTLQMKQLQLLHNQRQINLHQQQLQHYHQQNFLLQHQQQQIHLPLHRGPVSYFSHYPPPPPFQPRAGPCSSPTQLNEGGRQHQTAPMQQDQQKHSQPTSKTDKKKSLGRPRKKLAAEEAPTASQQQPATPLTWQKQTLFGMPASSKTFSTQNNPAALPSNALPPVTTTARPPSTGTPSIYNRPSSSLTFSTETQPPPVILAPPSPALVLPTAAVSRPPQPFVATHPNAPPLTASQQPLTASSAGRF